MKTYKMLGYEMKKLQDECSIESYDFLSPRKGDKSGQKIHKKSISEFSK